MGVYTRLGCVMRGWGGGRNSEEDTNEVENDRKERRGREIGRWWQREIGREEGERERN